MLNEHVFTYCYFTILKSENFSILHLVDSKRSYIIICTVYIYLYIFIFHVYKMYKNGTCIKMAHHM